MIGNWKMDMFLVKILTVARRFNLVVMKDFD